MSIPLDSQHFINTVATISKGSGTKVCAGSKEFISWLSLKNIPNELINLFSECSPQGEVWAGAGTLFGENSIVRWNDDFPSAVSNGLLIIGSAPNGDFICLDLLSGEVGYVCHEMEWSIEPRAYYVSVSKTLGAFIRDINGDSSIIPEDYWEAKG